MSAVDRIAADAIAAAGLLGDDVARQASDNADALEILRDAVTRAEAGDIVGVVVITATAAGSVGTSFASGSVAFSLIGGAELVKARLIDLLNGEE